MQNRFGAFFTLLLGILLIAQVAVAQPTVTLAAAAQDNYNSVIFTFTQNDLASMEGCHYNLFAADKRKDLNTLPGKGLSIATFTRNLSEVQIIASPLPHLARKLGKHNPQIQNTAKVYFRALISCPGATNGHGEIISISMKTFKSGSLLSVNRLVKAMKYNMAYYTNGQ